VATVANLVRCEVQLCAALFTLEVHDLEQAIGVSHRCRRRESHCSHTARFSPKIFQMHTYDARLIPPSSI
jgi:hypothetical protein